VQDAAGSTVSQTVDFAVGAVNGQVMQIAVIPEPGAGLLLASAGAGWLVCRFIRRRQDDQTAG